jgi:hypothetical protein
VRSCFLGERPERLFREMTDLVQIGKLDSMLSGTSGSRFLDA